MRTPRARIAGSGDWPNPLRTARGPLVVLLEPSTEGRLAETLARHDEGWCATWWPAEAGSDATGDPAPPTSVRRPGPLGPERLVLGGRRSGPHRLLVEAATIAS